MARLKAAYSFVTDCFLFQSKTIGHTPRRLSAARRGDPDDPHQPLEKNQKTRLHMSEELPPCGQRGLSQVNAGVRASGTASWPDPLPSKPSQPVSDFRLRETPRWVLNSERRGLVALEPGHVTVPRGSPTLGILAALRPRQPTGLPG